jgi:hypothetical protein
MELAPDRTAQFGWELGEDGVNPVSKCQGAGIDELKFQLDTHSRQTTSSEPILEHGMGSSYLEAMALISGVGYRDRRLARLNAAHLLRTRKVFLGSKKRAESRFVGLQDGPMGASAPDPQSFVPVLVHMSPGPVLTGWA